MEDQFRVSFMVSTNNITHSSRSLVSHVERGFNLFPGNRLALGPNELHVEVVSNFVAIKVEKINVILTISGWVSAKSKAIICKD